MDKTYSESISDLIRECQALVNEQVKLEDKQKRNEELLKFLLEDDPSEIRWNKSNIQNLQNENEQISEKMEEIEGEKKVKKKEIRDLIKKRLRKLRGELESAMSNNKSNEIYKYTELLTNTTSRYNEILKLIQYKRIHMNTLFDSSGGGSKLR
jgi:DNA repair exonuclease SbcCD ATPase subunit